MIRYIYVEQKLIVVIIVYLLILQSIVIFIYANFIISLHYLQLVAVCIYYGNEILHYNN